jgi:hypothetical protein
MSDFFEHIRCSECGVIIDAKDYTWEEAQRGLCEYCIEDLKGE